MSNDSNILSEELEDKGNHFEISLDGVDDIHEGLKTIESRSKALIHFIDAYREYTSIPEPDAKTIIVKELLEEIHGLMKVDIRQSSTKFSCSTQPNSLTISADEEQIQQVLINMFLNALNAMSGEGTLRISTFKDSDDSLAIEVEDDGAGISEADMAKLFVPFYTSREEGTGLGLPITKRIVEQHGGNISIRSIVGKGTCVKITLPINGNNKETRIKDEKVQDTGS